MTELLDCPTSIFDPAQVRRQAEALNTPGARRTQRILRRIDREIVSPFLDSEHEPGMLEFLHAASALVPLRCKLHIVMADGFDSRSPAELQTNLIRLIRGDRARLGESADLLLKAVSIAGKTNDSYNRQRPRFQQKPVLDPDLFRHVRDFDFSTFAVAFWLDQHRPMTARVAFCCRHALNSALGFEASFKRCKFGKAADRQAKRIAEAFRNVSEAWPKWTLKLETVRQGLEHE